MAAPRILALFGSGEVFGSERANVLALKVLQETGCTVHVLVREEQWAKRSFIFNLEVLDVLIIYRIGDKHNVPLRMLGFCNQTQMPAVYAAADVLILPSTGPETWGPIANKAVACGLPAVLSAAVGCEPDLIALARAGTTFQMGDVVACGQARNDVLTCPPAKMDIAQVSDRHSIAAAAQGIVAALNAIKTEH